MNRIRHNKIIITIIIATIAGLLAFAICNIFFRLDFSQDYRDIVGVENIIFQSNAQRDCFFKRCFWGLQRTDAPASYEPYNVIVPSRELETVQDYVGDVPVRQAVPSPDGNYILYCEIEYDYKHSGLTDDEYCYYKVYNMETNEVVTLYEAYREWYNLDWR